MTWIFVKCWWMIFPICSVFHDIMLPLYLEFKIVNGWFFFCQINILWKCWLTDLIDSHSQPSQQHYQLSRSMLLACLWACYTIRIFNGCEALIENSVMRVTVRLHEACRVMPKSLDAEQLPEWRNFQFAPKNHYGFFFLHTLPSTIAFKLEYVLFYQFCAKITTFFDQEKFGTAPVL